MSVEDLLLRRCAKVLNLCDVVNGRYRLYFMSKSLEGGELCLRHDIYRLSHSQGTPLLLSLTGTLFEAVKASSLTMQAIFAISQQSRIHRL